MQIGANETMDYLRCRRRWNLGSPNRENLEKLMPHSTALPLGTVIHLALSKWLEAPHLNLAELYQVAATLENNKIVERFAKAMGYKPAASELEKLHTDFMTGYAMMENYQAYWKAPLPPGFELVHSEQEVSVPIPGTEHTDENGEQAYHYLRGRLDAIIKETASGKLYVLEHKSYGNRPREAVLRTNFQFLAYEYILKALDIGPVGGIAYDGMWKRAAPPRDKTMHDLFWRLRIERPPAELAEFERMMADIANEMASGPALYINRTWDGSCDWGCQFSELCIAMSRGEDTDYIRRTMYQQRESYAETNSHDGT